MNSLRTIGILTVGCALLGAAVLLFSRPTGPAAPGAPAEARPAAATPGKRIVAVRWLGVSEKGLPIDVTALNPRDAVAVGAKGKVVYRFVNRSAKPVRFQAVYHVAPGPAHDHFHKYECFCFTNQKLAPGEVKELPVGYTFDDGLPDNIESVTVAYTLFPLGAHD